MRCAANCVARHSLNHFRWLLTSLVISNIETWAFLKISLSFASALIMVFLALSCRPFFLMYSHSFLVTSVRGSGLSPMMAASAALGVSAFMNAALGARFLAGAAFFVTGAAFFAGAAFLAGAAFFAGAAFLAGAAFFAGAFFAVAIDLSIGFVSWTAVVAAIGFGRLHHRARGSYCWGGVLRRLFPWGLTYESRGRCRRAARGLPWVCLWA
jgi:hypothetical protein